MKRSFSGLATFLLFVAPVVSRAAEQLIPAGTLIQCTVSEPKLSSKTTDLGDPVLCQLNHVELYGRYSFPYGSYLTGRFEEYKDPGHFVGKGWMELRFERIVIPYPSNQILPITAKVVYTPKYPVDKQGRILGKGHPVRDAVEWAIPVLWPIDLLNLPRRGPRPVLKAETRLTLKVMDDVSVPLMQQAVYEQPYDPPPAAAPAPAPYRSPYSAPQQYPYGFRQRAPMSYQPEAAAPMTTTISQETGRRPFTVLVLRDGNQRLAADYWFEGENQVRYVAANGNTILIPAGLFDLERTVEANTQRGVAFEYRVRE